MGREGKVEEGRKKKEGRIEKKEEGRTSGY